MAQQKWVQLGTMRLWVPSLASLRGLMIWHCRELWCRLQMWLWRWPAAVALMRPPSLGPSICLRCSPERQKRQKKKKKKKKKKKRNERDLESTGSSYLLTWYLESSGMFHLVLQLTRIYTKWQPAHFLVEWMSRCLPVLDNLGVKNIHILNRSQKPEILPPTSTSLS